MSAGFRFAETMRGGYHMLAHPERELPMEFSIEARVDGLRRFARDRTARITGVCSFDGLCRHAQLDGTLGMKLLDDGRLPYDFTFRADDGKRYRFRGEKQISLANLRETMTVLPASLYDDGGEEIGRAIVRFDVRHDLRDFLLSFRPRLSFA
jgi:hypothetical protein